MQKNVLVIKVDLFSETVALTTSVRAISNDQCKDLMPDYFPFNENIMCATDAGESFCRHDAGDGGNEAVSVADGATYPR